LHDFAYGWNKPCLDLERVTVIIQMNPPEKEFIVQPRNIKSKFLSVGARMMNTLARPKLALLFAAAFVALAPFQLSAQ